MGSFQIIFDSKIILIQYNSLITIVQYIYNWYHTLFQWRHMIIKMCFVYLIIN